MIELLEETSLAILSLFLIENPSNCKKKIKKKEKKKKSSNVFVEVSKVRLATIVKGNQKAPFSIATTPWCRGGCYSFPWIAEC